MYLAINIRMPCMECMYLLFLTPSTSSRHKSRRLSSLTEVWAIPRHGGHLDPHRVFTKQVKWGPREHASAVTIGWWCGVIGDTRGLSHCVWGIALCCFGRQEIHIQQKEITIDLLLRKLCVDSTNLRVSNREIESRRLKGYERFSNWIVGQWSGPEGIEGMPMCRLQSRARIDFVTRSTKSHCWRTFSRVDLSYNIILAFLYWICLLYLCWSFFFKIIDV